ncbi:hypothetical protein [Clostridium rectalis]|uniref:hypothetical protein n=1 Tax=Clostridium rectalis TaxID=2040295 RepID=UPI000F63E20E|nr:hypothetical protein [Clostridium rectalis]
MESTDIYELDEIYYTDIEAMQVVTEIRTSLQLNMLNPTITKKDLIDWFANIQIKKKDINFCKNVTCIDLIEIARECGLKIIQ